MKKLELFFDRINCELKKPSSGKMKSNRENFSKLIISRLERRVNGHCSNPDCRVPTSGPNLGDETANCIGVAAHIAAASPGGPRYDKLQSTEERKSIRNAIWLCVNCSTQIDRDSSRYTVTFLNRWKQLAEQIALDEMGKTPVSRKSHEALKALAIGDFAEKGIVSAVREICKLSAIELRKIDPRFSVDVEYKNNQATYIFSPQEVVDCTLSAEGSAAEELLRKYSDMVDHGSAIEMDIGSVNLTGSPLFDLHGDSGKLIFSPVHRPEAICKVSIEGLGQTVYLDEVRGALSGGRKSVTFRGITFGGYLSLTLVVNFDEKKGAASRVTLEQNYSVWEGEPISRLPYFRRVFEFYEAAISGDCLKISLEISGNQVISGSGSDILKELSAENVFSTLRYISNAREIAAFAGLDLAFKSGIKIGSEDVREVQRIREIVIGTPKKEGRDIGMVSFISNFFESQLPFMELPEHKFGPMHVTYEFSNPVNLCGVMVKMPKVIISYTALKVVRKSQLDDGAVEIFMQPEDSCLCHISSLQ